MTRSLNITIAGDVMLAHLVNKMESMYLMHIQLVILALTLHQARNPYRHWVCPVVS